ncbi:uncharacterized protein G2W53_012376 [Senna tora]|uniref:Uncharacterized protein n=1 Tax=Senna tora TaxID=362788 RepID=A0A834WQK9_9FABA|nr:uncharacterized protein G2W53_012376 [Senna tora]
MACASKNPQSTMCNNSPSARRPKYDEGHVSLFYVGNMK